MTDFQEKKMGQKCSARRTLAVREGREEQNSRSDVPRSFLVHAAVTSAYLARPQPRARVIERGAEETAAYRAGIDTGHDP